MVTGSGRVGAVAGAGDGPPRPLRLLVVGSHYPPHVLGGYELASAGVVAWLRGRGHEVTVLTTTYGVEHRGVVEEAGAHGELVVRGLDLQWSDYEIRRPAGLALVRAERRQRTLTRSLVARQRPDVAVVWHMAAVSKSVLATVGSAGIPMLVVLQEPWPAWDLEADAWTGRWSRPAVRPAARLLKPLLRPLAGLVAPTDLGQGWAAAVPAYSSEWLRRTVEEAVPQWRERGAVVGNGVDLATLARERPEDDPLGSPLRVLYAGRVEPRKGVRTAVEALAAACERGLDATLDVVGWADPAHERELRTLAAGLGIESRVRWPGPVAREALAGAYRDHDVCVVPSVWEEPFGLVPLEAMATGCLVVATGTGGSGEFLVDGVNALLHRVEDAAGLAAALARLAGDPDLVRRMRRAGRDTAARYDMPAYAARLEGMALGLTAP